MKKLTAVILTAVILAALGVAAFGAGTSDDPLITLSYIESIFRPAAKQAAGQTLDEKLNAVLTEAETKLPEPDVPSGYTMTDGQFAFTASDASPVFLAHGTSVVLMSGSAKIEITSGAVIDVSTGGEVASGAAMELYHRYFTVEDTYASVIPSAASTLAIDGRYKTDNAGAAPGLPYKDVAADSWFLDAAKYVRNTGLYHDSNAELFRPNEPATRAELVYALWVANGRPEPKGTAAFIDLTDEWSVKAITWAAENGIVTGYSATEFGPQNGARREQIAAIMYRYAAWLGKNVTTENDMSRYEDVSLISAWAYDAMRWANGMGLITGVTETTLRPQGEATRAQIATIIMRYTASSG